MGRDNFNTEISNIQKLHEVKIIKAGIYIGLSLPFYLFIYLLIAFTFNHSHFNLSTTFKKIYIFEPRGFKAHARVLIPSK
jgi:hypothetical protein